MRAMMLDAPGQPLKLGHLAVPEPAAHDVLLKVLACGVCRTDLHILDGELPAAPPGIVPGHEVVGRVVALGSAVTRFRVGDRVGIPWLGGTCGHCAYCADQHENLCDTPGVHRLRPQRRFRRVRAGRCALLLRAAGCLRRRACGAAAVRGTDRLPGLPSVRRLGTACDWACMALARPRTSSARSRWRKGSRCMRSCAAVIGKAPSSH